jgi:thioredoxin-like negative regulator of GroEL
MSIQLHTIAKKYSEHLSVIKYDVEGKNTKSLKVEMLLQGVHVRGLPTLLLYNNGAPVATHSGAIAEQDLHDWLDNNLATISDTKSVSKKEVEERDAVNEVLTSGKRGFVSFVDRYTL